MKTIVVCGGVSANKWLRERLHQSCRQFNFECKFPDFSLCTDNGAMIAGVAQARYNEGLLPETHKVTPSLPLV